MFVEEASARLVWRVCRPLERGATNQAAKHAQRGSYEVLIWMLACLENDSRLYKKGIFSNLRLRIDRAFQASGDAASSNKVRWGELGKAKYHTFTPNAKFGTRSARPRRQQQDQRQQQEGREQEYVHESEGTGEPTMVAEEDLLEEGEREQEYDHGSEGADEPTVIVEEDIVEEGASSSLALQPPGLFDEDCLLVARHEVVGGKKEVGEEKKEATGAAAEWLGRGGLPLPQRGAEARAAAAEEAGAAAFFAVLWRVGVGDAGGEAA